LASPRTPPFQAIYDEYVAFVRACARALGVAPDAMDDAVQEIFLVIHARVHTLSKSNSLRSWIYGVTRRVASNYRRASRARDNSSVALGADPDFEGGEPTPLEAAARQEDLALLYLLLAKLDPAKREAFIMAELEEMTGAEIAEATHVPLNTVYSRLRVARGQFEDVLAQHAPPANPRSAQSTGSDRGTRRGRTRRPT
jgi:RNA polymerase sigma-70 factor (ECF subfamily)